jgi:hypothetical protein
LELTIKLHDNIQMKKGLTFVEYVEDWELVSTLQLEKWYNWSSLDIERIEPPSLIFLLIHTKFCIYIQHCVFFFFQIFVMQSSLPNQCCSDCHIFTLALWLMVCS